MVRGVLYASPMGPVRAILAYLELKKASSGRDLGFYGLSYVGIPQKVMGVGRSQSESAHDEQSQTG